MALTTLIGAPVAAEAQAPEATYLGQAPPGGVPAVFAPGIVSLEDRFEQFLLYAPDGRSLIFGVTNGDWSAFTLLQMELGDAGWGAAEPAAFLGEDSTALTAAFSFDDGRVFFTGARPSHPPSDIWVS